MGRLAGSYVLPAVERALRALGEEPRWQKLPRTQHQHRSVCYHAVVNIYTSTGTVTVQGSGAAQFEDALSRALGNAPYAPASAAEAGAVPGPAPAGGCGGGGGCGDGCGGGGGAAWHLYVDGACPGNQQVRERSMAAGWGVAVFGGQPGPADGGSGAVQARPPAASTDSLHCELYGPVVTDPRSHLSLGAEVGSNNTGELSAIGEALLWLRDEAPGPRSLPAVVFYDSQYAANIATRRHVAHKNLLLARTVQGLCDEVRRQRPLKMTYVKGHSGCPGNELADQLANRGVLGHWGTASRRWSLAGPVAARAAKAESELLAGPGSVSQAACAAAPARRGLKRARSASAGD